MYLVTANQDKQLVYIGFIGRVSADDLRRGQKDLARLIADFAPGFKLLVDLERLESMAPDCHAELGKSMEFLDDKHVGLVVRVIPDNSMDLGLNIIAKFHYRHRPRSVTCNTMVEALEVLEL